MLVIFEQLLRKLFNVNVNVQDCNFTLNTKKFVKLTTLVSCENWDISFYNYRTAIMMHSIYVKH